MLAESSPPPVQPSASPSVAGRTDGRAARPHRNVDGGIVLEDGRADLRIDTAIAETGMRRQATVTLSGVVCAGTACILADEVQRLLRAGADTVRFDLAALRICTSDAVEQWIALSDHLERVGGTVSLTSARGAVRRVLEAIGSPELAGKWS